MADVYGYLGNRLYGNYRNRKFSDVYPDYDTFLEDYNFYKENCGFDPGFPAPAEGEIEKPKIIYHLILARYANHIIASSDENRFKLEFYSKIYQYSPFWAKKMQIQKEIRALSIEELQKGSELTNNKAFNPDSAPATNNYDALTYTNAQSKTFYKKSKLDAYSLLLNLLERDVTQEFLRKFENLFIVIAEPEEPLYYIQNLENYEIEEDY